MGRMFERSSIYILAVTIGCYQPSATFAPCTVTCETTCPDGLTCIGGLCRLPSGSCDTPTDGGPVDGSADGSVAHWEAVPVAELMGIHIGDPTFRGDLKEMFYGNGADDYDIVQRIRPSITSPWGAPVVQTAINSAKRENAPELSDNEIFVSSNRDRTSGTARDMFRSTRTAPGEAWSAPQPVPELNQSDDISDLGIQPGGLRAILGLRFMAPADLFESTRESVSAPWTTPVRLDELCSEFDDLNGTYTSDGLTVYFSSNRGDGSTHDLYTATRPALDQPFAPPRAIDELNMLGVHDADPWISPDGKTLYFLRENRLWEARLVE